MLYLPNVSFYILTIVFLPGLFFAAYRAAFLAGPADEGIFLALRVSCGCLYFVSDFCFCLCFCFVLIIYLYFVSSVILPSEDVLC